MQDSQTEAEVAPVTLANVPASQGVHTEAATSLANVPEPQSTQIDAPAASELRPRVQLAQAASTLSAPVVLPNVPASQGEQLVAAALSLKKPGPQDRQEDWPVDDEYVPAVQCLHVTWK